MGHLRRERPVVNADQRLASPAPPDTHQAGAPAPRAFVELYENNYRDLLRLVIRLGATLPEAEDAVADALTEVFGRWSDVRNPLGYARKAAASNFIKVRTRGLDRTRRRLVERAAAEPSPAAGPEFDAAENNEWVRRLLSVLPPAERVVMALTVDGYQPIEIAGLLAKSQTSVRRNLCDGRRRLIDHLRQDGGIATPGKAER